MDCTLACVVAVTGIIYYFDDPKDIVIGFFGCFVVAVISPVVMYLIDTYRIWLEVRLLKIDDGMGVADVLDWKQLRSSSSVWDNLGEVQVRTVTVC